DIYDSLLVPTLALAKTDQFQGTLEAEAESKLLASMRVLAEDLADRVAAPPSGKLPAVDPVPAGISVVCIPASDESDEIISLMLARLLTGAGCRVETLSPGLSAGEKVAALANRPADLV